MDFSEITIKDKALFDRCIREFNPQISEITFTNLFMWRKTYGFRYTVVNELLCLVAMSYEKQPFFLPPIGRLEKESFKDTVKKLAEYSRQQGWPVAFKRVPEEMLEYFKAAGAARENIIFDRNNSDYLYLTQDMIHFRGKKYHGKKNHVNRFVKSYSHEYVPMGTEHLAECMRIMEAWCARRDCSCRRGQFCEKHAVKDLLDSYGELGCKGALIKVEGRFEAFTIGELLNEDTTVIHVEKANDSINGLYTFVFQQFCLHEWKDTTYVNREQDLGAEGLRKSKLSYQPVRLVNKYTVLID